MQKIYLAGGLRSNWQAKVKELPGFTFFCPRDKERPKGDAAPMTVSEYGTWDLHYVRQCDIVFAYAERTNPSCIGMAVEMGYAKALGKTVILVLEPDNETLKESYLLFLTKAANITFSDFESGLTYLRSFNL